MAQTTIAVKKCPSYEQRYVDKAVEDVFTLLGGIKKYIKKGDRVLLKPNLLAPGKPEKVRTTHPAVVLAVAKAVRKAGGVVYVGDSPAIKVAKYIANSNGLLEVCEKNKLNFLNFETRVDVKHPKGKLIKVFPLSDEVGKADVIINIPKIKTHGLTALTCCVKNNFGCVVGLKKSQYHVKFPERHDFSKMLLDLYECVKPQLTIVDGIIGMEGKGGPGNGTPVDIGVIVGGTECVAMDVHICHMLGIDPLKVPTNLTAKEEGYGITEPKKMEIVGDRVSFSKGFTYHQPRGDVAWSLPRGFIRWSNNRLTARPIIKDNCIGCGDCVKMCQAKAMKLIDKVSHIDTKKCIKCYCCHEVCRYEAIDLKRPLLGRILGL